jgi:DNA-directed RNA polymerase
MDVRNSGSGLLENSPILQREMSLETEAVSRGVARYHRLKDEAISRGDAAGLKPVERLLLHWFEPMVMAIKEEQLQCFRGAPGVGRGVYGPVIRSLDAERIAVVTMHNTLGLTICEPTGVKVVSLTYSIGAGVIAEIHWDMLKKENRDSIDELNKKFKRLTTARRNWWAKQHLSDHLWNRRVCTHLGARLIEILMEIATCENYDKSKKFVPAFRRRRVAVKGGNKMSGVISMTSEARELIKDGHVVRAAMRPRYLPMVVPPYHWSKDHDGGFIHIRTPFTSKPTKEQKEALEEADLNLIYESLNRLSGTGWLVNTKMLAVLNEEWHTGGNSAGLPARENKPMPPRPTDIATNPKALKEWKAQATEVHQFNHRVMSRRVEFMTMLDTAEMLGDSTFYLPHQMCFRSRAFPIPPHFNHHGSDPPRSMMLFNRGMELTDKGWRQIQIHTANKWGMDKVSYDDRVAWDEDNTDNIIASARDPHNHRWWTGADDPLQFLAACQAHDDTFIAEHLACQVDGTCNGLQHYAGMSLNPSDAKAVNLSPGDIPNDVYIDVMEVVVDMIKREVRHEQHAQLALDVMERKIVKQPIMTTVYGVTRIGARSQIQDKLRDVEGLAQVDRFRVSEYLSHKVLKGLGTVCRGAGEIMDWITLSIKEILKAYPHDNIRWVTPLGFPVVQPYRNFNSCRITTCLQEVTYSYGDECMPAMVRRHVQGGPANGVHSEDATHMHCTNISCGDHDIEFAEVHDSYWTLAEQMDDMSLILRDEFVNLHESYWCQDMYNQWRELYPRADIPLPPARGDFDLSLVRKSPYFFN